MTDGAPRTVNGGPGSPGFLARLRAARHATTSTLDIVVLCVIVFALGILVGWLL